jgi:hypothetical protein
MAVGSVREVHEGRRGQDDTFATQTTYVRNFIVITDNPKDGPDTVLASDDLPTILESWQPPNLNLNANIVCVNRVPEQDARDRCVWRVRCEYTSDTVANAILEPAEVDWQTELVPFAYSLCYSVNYRNTPTFEPVYDIYPDPFPFGAATLPTVAAVNSAGDPFDPPPMGQRPLPKLVIVRNEASSPLSSKQRFERTLNTDTFQGYAGGCSHMLQITGQKVHPTYTTGSFDYFYWKVRYEILFDDLGFSQKVIDAGFRYKDGGGVLQQCRDLYNQPYSKPTALDGLGGVLPGPPFTYVWAKVNTIRAVSWADLALPSAAI